MPMRTIFRKARVFDGRTFLDGPHDIEVLDDRIVGVRRTGSDIPADATVIDCTGTTMLPGFIDAHVHLMIEEPNGAEAAQKAFSLPFYESIGHARATLASGVTSVRDAGGTDQGMREAIDSGLISGPRTRLSIGLLSITGGHGDNTSRAGVELPAIPFTIGHPRSVVDGVDSALRTTREMFRLGADQIKICTTGGVLSPNDDPRHAHFSPAEIEAIVSEASNHGSYVMAHALGAKGVKNALRGGVHSIEHGIYIDDEAIELFIEKGAYLVPTLATLDAVFEFAKVKHVPEGMLAKGRDAMEHQRANFAAAVAAGVRIAMGSDAGVGKHGTGLRELPHMARGGLGLDGALAAGTSVAAELLPGLAVGSLEPGNYADLVQLDMELTMIDQLDDIASRVAGVWKGGTKVSPIFDK
jgi:imidazolonepropionase-like amidohydrolase